MRHFGIGEKVKFTGKIVSDVNKRVGGNRTGNRRRVHIFLLKNVFANGKYYDHLWIKLEGAQSVKQGDTVKGYGYGQIYFRKNGSADFHVDVKNIEKMIDNK